jgi:hypothetical protein
MSPAETLSAGRATDPQRVTREALLYKITAQAESLIPDITGGPRAHEIALTLVQLAAAYAAIVGSENQ